MYFIDGKKVYVKEGSAYRNIGVSVKNKVIVTKEFESVTVIPGQEIVNKLKSPVVATLDEVIARFGVSEERPLAPAEDKKK